MKDTLCEGLTHSKKRIVPPRELVPELDPDNALFQTFPPVFATAYMIAFIEDSCAELLHMHLDKGEGSVGVHVNVSHEAATPEGMEVTSQVRVSKIDGRRISFQIELRDEVDIISRGSHERFVINPKKFAQKVREKAG